MADRKRWEPKIAVALGYDPKRDEAPQVIASGKGALADSILAAAREHGVPVQEDHPLAGALAKLEAGTAIPPELYTAVAEVLAFLWRLEEQNRGMGWGEGKPR